MSQIPLLYLQQSFVLLLSLSLALAYCLKTLRKNRLEIFSVPLFFPMLAYLLITIISASRSSGKFDAAMVSVFTFSLTGIYFLIPQLLRSSRQVLISLYIITLSASIAGLARLTGAAYVSGLLLLISAPIIFTLLFSLLKNKALTPKKLAAGAFLIILCLSAAMVTLNTLKLTSVNNNPEIPVFLNQKIGWIIALETIKNQPLFGIGPANFINAYTLFKPLYAPNVSYPNLNFLPASASSNDYFQILTTVGILGFLTYSLIIIKALSQLLKHPNPITISLFISFIIYLIIQALMPIPIILTFFAFIFLALAQSLININKESALIIELPSQDQETALPLKAVPFAACLALSIILIFASFKVTLGEIYEKEAVKEAQANNGQKAYDLAQKAIDQNPMSDLYHINMAQIAYALAQTTLSQKQGSPSGELTDNDKNLIGSLYQKAITEAKTASDLNPQKVYNLSTLAAIYASLAQAAPNIEQFSIDTYQKAVSLDPTNPKLRLELGGIYFGRNEFATASAIFRDAVFLQANYANAHYNLGYALLRLNQFDAGLAELKAAADLLTDQDMDKARVLKEIEDIQSQLAKREGQQKPILNTPPVPAAAPSSSPKP